VLRSSRVLTIGALLALAVVTWLPRLRGPIDLRWDGGTYYVLGTALVEGRGYRLLNEPGEIEAIQYPPLVPALVAVHQWALGTSDPMVVGPWLRLLFFAMFTGHVLATYVLLERALPRGYAFAGAAICLLHPFGMFLSDLLSAELPFALLAVLFVLFSERPGNRGHPVLAAACVTAAYLVRTAGIALLAAWVGESLLRREFRRATVRCVIALLPIVGWQAYVAEVQSSASYRKPAYPYQRADYLFYNVSYTTNLSLRDPHRPELGKASVFDLVSRVVDNATGVPRSLGEAVSTERVHWQNALGRLPVVGRATWGRSEYWVATFTVVSLGLVVLGGIAIQLAGSERLGGLCILAYAVLVCLTSWPLQWRRYWWPLAPFLVLALLQCLLFLGRWPTALVSSRRVIRVLVVALVGLVLTVEAFTAFHLYRTIRGEAVLHDRQGRPREFSLFYYGMPDRELDAALEWLRAEAGSGDVVAASMPHWAYLVTGRKTVMPPFEPDPQRAEALLDAVPVRYIVMDSTDVDIARLMRRSTVEVLRGGPSRWKEIYTGSSGLVAVYERVREPVAGGMTRGAEPSR
jgi:hypothetical protein